MRLGIGRTKAYALVRDGELPSIQIGRLRRVHMEALDQYARQLSARSAGGTAA